MAFNFNLAINGRKVLKIKTKNQQNKQKAPKPKFCNEIALNISADEVFLSIQVSAGT